MSDLVKEYLDLSARLKVERDETDISTGREDEYLDALDVLWYKMTEEEQESVERKL